MYELYLWNPWNFGQWVYKGEYKTKREIYEQITNKRETTYKITKDGLVIELHEAASHCWRCGMVRPK